MKRLALAVLLLTLVGCDKQTKYGECVGLTKPKDPALLYSYSINNIVVGVVFAETVIVPVMVVFDSLYCPVGRKAAP